MKSFIFIFSISLLLVFGCKQGKKYHDESQTDAVAITNSSIKDILKYQQELNEEFKDPNSSPLPDRFRKDFETLDFFPADTSYIVTAKLVRTPNAVPFLMPTNTDRKSKETVYGIVHFSLNGQEHQLEVYQNEELMLEEGYEDYLFLPFTDLTNGEETYGGGRYLDLSIPKGDTMILDFNKAYNPYCVYNKKYSCPLVPSVNHLRIKVTAGLKDFQKE